MAIFANLFRVTVPDAFYINWVMAVFTHITEKQMAQLLARYNLGVYTKHIGIAEGSTNSTFLVHSTLGKIIATLFEERSASADELALQINCINLLAKHKLPIPRIFYSKQGTFVQQLAGKQLVLQEFCAGQPLKAPQAGHTQTAGAILARIHNTLPSGKTFLPKPLFNPQSVHNLLLQADTLLTSQRETMQAISFLVQESLHQQQVWQTAPKLPTGLCHGDYFIDNVFFDDTRVSGIIDWWFAAEDTFIYDLAIGLCAWGFDDTSGNLLPEHYNAFYTGYTTRRQLSEAEELMLPWALRRAALRFCATRLVDTLTQKGFIKGKEWQPCFARLQYLQNNQEVRHAS